MKQAAAAALVLLLLFFLMPFLFLRGEPMEPGRDVEPAVPQEDRVPEATPGPVDSGTMLRVKGKDGAVREMSMSDYLWGVVAAEMPASFELEALKAQAVAARTYALRRIDRPSSAHPEAQVCTDHTCCQAWKSPEEAAAAWGSDAETYTARIRAAVAGTDGIAALYDGKPIDAVFFSSAAGKTVDAVEVWGNHVPYLTGVESPEGEEVPNYHSTVELTAQQFREKLLAAHPDAVLEGAPSGWFGPVEQDSAGGVKTITIGGVSLTGGEVRTLFALRSAHFTVEAQGETIRFSVTGYGHGVGMSQYGANALARSGRNFKEILCWYYQGVDLEVCPAY